MSKIKTASSGTAAGGFVPFVVGGKNPSARRVVTIFGLPDTGRTPLLVVESRAGGHFCVFVSFFFCPSLSSDGDLAQRAAGYAALKGAHTAVIRDACCWGGVGRPRRDDVIVTWLHVVPKHGSGWLLDSPTGSCCHRHVLFYTHLCLLLSELETTLSSRLYNILCSTYSIFYVGTVIYLSTSLKNIKGTSSHYNTVSSDFRILVFSLGSTSDYEVFSPVLVQMKVMRIAMESETHNILPSEWFWFI